MFLLCAISFNWFNDKFIILTLGEKKKKNVFYNNLGEWKVIIHYNLGLN